MELDDDARYRAISGRDRRFEGRFVVGVRTTGVYCRPGCPARIPQRRNVAFFACAAAAEEAGFRACLRCRPEASPGSPAWSGTSSTVSRALRLIDDGALDGADVDDLAARLGVGARHLRRLFAEHLGASPSAVAHTRRVHFARTLLRETQLPIAEVALAAGFQSVRRFNDAMQATFRAAPRALRGGARRASTESKGDVVLRVAYRPPLGWSALLGFLRPRLISGVEAIDGDAYLRATDAGVVRVTPDEARRQVLVHARLEQGRGAALFDVVRRTTHLFDLDADPDAIARHLRRDATLRPLVRGGLRVPGAWDRFELCVRAVLGQQISVTRATALAGRLVEMFGEPLDAPAFGLTHRFPTASRLADADIARIGMPAARAATLRALARAASGGALVLDGRATLDDAVDALCRIPGIGPWTASYIAMRALREPDAFPEGDLVLRRAWGELDAARPLAVAAEAFRPWRAYAAMALWSWAASRGRTDDDDTNRKKGALA